MNEKLLAAHHKIVRHNGTVYRIIAFKLGNRVLADAENCRAPQERINLQKTRSTVGMALRQAVELGLVS